MQLPNVVGKKTHKCHMNFTGLIFCLLIQNLLFSDERAFLRKKKQKSFNRASKNGHFGEFVVCVWSKTGEVFPHYCTFSITKQLLPFVTSSRSPRRERLPERWAPVEPLCSRSRFHASETFHICKHKSGFDRAGKRRRCTYSVRSSGAAALFGLNPVCVKVSRSLIGCRVAESQRRWPAERRAGDTSRFKRGGGGGVGRGAWGGCRSDPRSTEEPHNGVSQWRVSVIN